MSRPLPGRGRLMLDVPRCAPTRPASPGAALQQRGLGPAARPVLEAVTGHLEREATSALRGARGADRVNDFYPAVADLIGAIPRDPSWRTRPGVGHGLLTPSVRAGDRVVSRRRVRVELLAFLQLRSGSASRSTCRRRRLRQLDLASLERAIGQRTRSSRYPRPTRAAVNPPPWWAHRGRHGVLYCSTPASRWASSRSTWAHRLPLLSATGASTCAARGTASSTSGATPSRPSSAFIDLEAAAWIDADTYTVRDDARRFEKGAVVAGQIGLGVAAATRRPSASTYRSAGQRLAASLRGELAKRPGITVHDQGTERCGIVTFSGPARRGRDARAAPGARHQVTHTGRRPHASFARARARRLVRASVLLQR